MTRKYGQPLVHVSRCKKSSPISSTGEQDVMVLSGACGRVFGVLSLMHLQILVTKYLTSSYFLGQKKPSFMTSKVRSYPKCLYVILWILVASVCLIASFGCFYHLSCEVSYHYSVPGLGVHAKTSWTDMILLQHLQL